jgi:hypothetical protein
MNFIATNNLHFFRIMNIRVEFNVQRTESVSVCANRISPPFSYYMTQSSRYLLKEGERSIKYKKRNENTAQNYYHTNNIHISEIS